MRTMDRIKSIVHRGKKIFILDVSNSAPGESVPIIKEAQAKIAMLPAKSALVLMDVTNAAYDVEGLKVLNEFGVKNTPFVKASAVVGAEGLRSVLLGAFRVLTHREVRACASHAEALD
jgi:hypothetical protein